jgi:plastocyanin
VTAPRTARLLAALGALLVACAVQWLPAPAAAAAKTHVVTVGVGGPDPSTVTVARGDRVQFHNSDQVAHRVRSSAGGWSYDSKDVAPGGRSPVTPAFTTAGTFRYTDAQVGLVVRPPATGNVVVPSTTPSTTPSTRPSTTPAPSSSAGASPRPGATRSAGPAPGTAGPVPTQSGMAVLPGFGPGVVPTLPVPTPSTGPAPAVAPTVPPSATPAAAVGDDPVVTYGDKEGIVQGSAHRYGLPALLALVGIAGVVSLLVRFLLAQPAARRTPPVVGSES